MAAQGQLQCGTANHFRLDVPLHDLLTNAPPKRMTQLAPGLKARGEKLPEPMFPLHPNLLTGSELKSDQQPTPDAPYKRRWTAALVYRALRGWLFPYVKSRVLPGDFHPIIAYLFTEWKCNLTATTVGRSKTALRA